MKTRAKKKEDLEALTEQFNNSKSAMVLSFNKLTVEKDQQFRGELRDSGIRYGVVKNTLARLAVKGTPFEDVTEHFHGVTSVAWTDGEPVDISKVIAKYVKQEKGVFEFKTGIVEGRVVTFDEVSNIASLPSKDILIAKLLYLLNAPAQRLATVLNAIPRNLAVVVKQVSEREGDVPSPKAEEVKAEDAPAADETPKADGADEKAADKGGKELKSGDDAGTADTQEKPEGGSEEAAVEETPESKDIGDEPSEKEDSE